MEMYGWWADFTDAMLKKKRVLECCLAVSAGLPVCQCLLVCWSASCQSDKQLAIKKASSFCWRCFPWRLLCTCVRYYKLNHKISSLPLFLPTPLPPSMIVYTCRNKRHSSLWPSPLPPFRFLIFLRIFSAEEQGIYSSIPTFFLIDL